MPHIFSSSALNTSSFDVDQAAAAVRLHKHGLCMCRRRATPWALARIAKHTVLAASGAERQHGELMGPVSEGARA